MLRSLSMRKEGEREFFSLLLATVLCRPSGPGKIRIQPMAERSFERIGLSGVTMGAILRWR